LSAQGSGRGTIKCSQYLAERLRVDKRYADFDRIVVETECQLVLVNTSPLHVGAGGERGLGEPVDLAVVIGSVAEVDERGNIIVYRGPVIPGSSLKGVLRSLAETIAVSSGIMRFAIDIPGKGERRCTGERLSEIEAWLAKANCSDENRKLVDNYLDDCFASPVVGLFGAPWLASHVRLYDAYPADLAEPPRRVVTHVSIDRLTGAQSPGNLYQIEVADAGVLWKTRMRITNIDVRGGDVRARLLRDLLRALAEGIEVGGKTSIGYGLLRLIAERSTCRIARLVNGRFVAETVQLSDILAVER